MSTHKQLFPEQYNHPAVGKIAVNGTVNGKVLRVVDTRFGQLAHIEGQPPEVAYRLADCELVEPGQR